MNFQSQVSQELWAAIENSYQAGQFTSAILDAMHYIGNAIRERTGLQTDGVALIGQAFNEKTPLLKVNKLQTESDRNIQNGVASILRGLYQAIRNPRSHDKYNDSKQDAEAIIVFVNYLSQIVLRSKIPFTIDGLLARVFDPHFVKRDRYAKLLVDEIPEKHRLDVMIEIARRKEEGSIEVLKLVSFNLLSKLKVEEKETLSRVISEELKVIDSDACMKYYVCMLPQDIWAQIDELARLRVENRFLEEIKKGIYNPKAGKCVAGALGTWYNESIRHSLLKNDFISALLTKLTTTNTYEQEYVFKFFFNALISILPDMNEFTVKRANSVLNAGLKAGNILFYNALTPIIETWEDWAGEPFKDAYESFVEKAESDDDIPF